MDYGHCGTKIVFFLLFFLSPIMICTFAKRIEKNNDRRFENGL